MKNILKILVLLVLAGGALVSCETYGTPEVELSSVAPLDGRWICYAFDYDDYKANPTTATRLELVEIYSSGTADNAPDKLWLHIGYMLQNNAMTIETISVKVDCSPKAGTFSLSNGKTVLAPPYFSSPYYRTTDPFYNHPTYGRIDYYFLHLYSGYPQMRPTKSTADDTVNITEGKVTVNGFNTPTGYKSDHIEFVLELPGVYKYVIEGHRHTGWTDDYSSTYDTSTAHHKWNVAAYIEEWIWRRDGVWPEPAYFDPENTFHNYVTLP